VLRRKALSFLHMAWLHRKFQYNPLYKVPFLWMKNRNSNYQIIDLEGAKKYKTSDTIFILGNGPSLNNLQKSQIDEVKRHDTFGINYSFLFDLVPTFHSLEDDKTERGRRFLEERLEPYRERCSKTIWCISERHLTRFIHPRIAPEFFPMNPVCWVYKYPNPIRLDEKRPFRDEDFSQSVVYRGSMSVAIDLVLRLGYKKLVLLGVDLDIPKHFYDGLPEMKEYVSKLDAYRRQNNFTKREAMIPKGNKFHPVDEYLYALQDYLLRVKGVNLFVGLKDNTLYPKIPAYFE